MADQGFEAFLDSGSQKGTEQSAPAASADSAKVDAKAERQTDVASTAKADEVSATSAQPKSDDQDTEIGPVPYKRFKTVLEKQHALERELSELRGYVSAQTQTKPQQQKSDEERQREEDDAVYADLPGSLRRVRDEIRHELTVASRKTTFEAAETALRYAKPDYDEKRQAFEQAIAAQAQAGDDSLQRAFVRARNPAQFIYDTGAMVLETRDVGSPAEYRAKVEKEVRAKVEAEVRKQLALESAAQASTTNAGARIASASPVAAREISDADLFRGVAH